VTRGKVSRLSSWRLQAPQEKNQPAPKLIFLKINVQLAELLKYTHAEHSDHGDVVAALEVMKDVAGMINERKRQMENIKKISMWQSTILNWQVMSFPL